MDIHFKKPLFQTGYSSHGFVTTFEDIVETECDRENVPFIEYDLHDIAQYATCPAIWVTKDPYDAFLYALSADAYNADKADIMATHPKWKDSIVSVDTTDFMILLDSDDGDDGVLLVDIR